MRRVIGRDFAGNLSRAAESFGVRQGTLSAFLSPRDIRGAGPKLVTALRDHLGWTTDDVLSGGKGESGGWGSEGLDPHPVRRQVIAALRDNGWPESILLELRNTELSDGDNPDAWFAEAERLKQFWGRAPKYNAEPMADDGPPGVKLDAVPPRKRRKL